MAAHPLIHKASDAEKDSPMLTILARSLHTAARFEPPRDAERPLPEPKGWNAPQHWLKPTAPAKDTHGA